MIVNKFYDNRINFTELKDGNRDTIIKWLFDSHFIEFFVTWIRKKTLDDTDTQDIVQEIYLYICEIPQDVWDSLYIQGEIAIKSYVLGMMRNQLKSGESKIWRKYTRYNNTELLFDDNFWQDYE